LNEQVCDVRFGVAVQLIQRNNDITVGEVTDTAHLLMHRTSSEPPLVIQLNDVV
jgi:hypothetical protein